MLNFITPQNNYSKGEQEGIVSSVDLYTQLSWPVTDSEPMLISQVNLRLLNLNFICIGIIFPAFESISRCKSITKKQQIHEGVYLNGVSFKSAMVIF